MRNFRSVLNQVLSPARLGFVFVLSFFHLSAGAQSSSGTLTVRGEAGPSQLFRQVKAARCQASTRNCSLIEYFDLNQPKALAEGTYILGFENSIYPGWVHLKAGESITLDLVKLQVPGALAKAAKVRVFRDFETEIEKNKLLFVQFYMARPLFRVSQYHFGDLYLASVGLPDVSLRLNYEICNRFTVMNSENEVALGICLAAAKAQGWRDMSPLFQFTGRDHMNRDLQRGQYLQNLVTEAGDRRQILMRRQLVSAPLKGSDFVSVFPGAYRFLADGPGQSSVGVTAGSQIQNFD